MSKIETDENHVSDLIAKLQGWWYSPSWEELKPVLFSAVTHLYFLQRYKTEADKSIASKDARIAELESALSEAGGSHDPS